MCLTQQVWSGTRHNPAEGSRESSKEPEYVAASMCGQEVLYLRSMLWGFELEQHSHTEVWEPEDNTACIQISENQVNRKFTWHIDAHQYFVRDLVRDMLVCSVGQRSSTSGGVRRTC
jgi:hypothetical protein